tara:strand:+ start:1385 stop:1648 length:264 start_codon:yes stop_codon:yes gene_type:complete
MAVTKQQVADNSRFHCETVRKCSRVVGPRGGVKVSIVEVRATGMMKTWKRDTARWNRPVKFGLYESHYIDQSNAGDYHLPEDCPTNI